MRVRSFLLTCACGLVSLSSIAIALEDLPTPIPIEVTLRGDGANNRVAGKLIATDEAGLTIRVGQEDRVLAWKELVPVSAFGVKFRLIDKKDAQQWLKLGEWAWSQGLTTEARSALGQARRLDKALAKQIDAILAGAPGSLIAAGDAEAAGENEAPATQPAAPEATPGSEGDDVTSVAQPVQPATGKIIYYTVPTAAENAASIALERRRMQEAERTLEVKFTEIETPHFLIYTDWDPREHEFLRKRCEEAYTVVARQFNQPPNGNVFVGKLPIYMFATQKAFQRFASEFDEFSASDTVLGYFRGGSIEQGHMAMWKPGVGTGVGAGGSKDDAMRNWGRVLVHEFSHAFIHRYKSNARIPRWLNEGTAEMIAQSVLPTNNYRGRARSAAVEEVDVMPLFDDKNMPSGYYYPVMMTMAESLLKQDKKKFIELFDEIKAGTEPEEALKKVYGFDYTTLAKGWAKYAKNLR